VLHNTHLLPNGQYKASYRHLIQEADCCDALVTLTQEQYHDLLALGLAPDRVRVIPHPLQGKLAGCEAMAKTSKRVIYLARYAPEKQHDALIRVFQRVLVCVPDAELHTYGVGALKHALEDQVKALGLQDSIIIHGFVNDIASVYNSASLGVMSSREEGFSLFGLECLSHGCPLVAFAVQYGPRDLLEGQDAGFLIEPGNEEAMAYAVIDLLQHPEKIEAMRPNAIRSANRFQVDNVVREWQAWWTDIQAIAEQKAQATAMGKSK
jgi:glycosyltransferase involved in cell wall biosynthesis